MVPVGICHRMSRLRIAIVANLHFAFAVLQFAIGRLFDCRLQSKNCKLQIENVTALGRRGAFSVGLLLAIVAAAQLQARAQLPLVPEELPRLAPLADQYLGALSCASASCHARQTDEGQTDPVSRREFLVWLEHDPHARAARTLDSPPFQRILNFVSSGREDG